MTSRCLALLALLSISVPAQAAPIRIGAVEAQRIGLKLAYVERAVALPLASLPGMVVPPPNGRVAVAAPFAGVVRQSFVIEGQSVRKGQRLALIQSREVLQTGAELARAQARLDVARRAAARTGRLATEGIVSGARADEAQAALREAEVEVAEKARILRLANADAASGNYALIAPIAGRVTEAKAQTGSALDGFEAPYVIDAGGSYNVEAQMPARLVGQIRPGMRVRIGQGGSGRVLAVGTTIDPGTRSASLKASVPAGPETVAGRTVALMVLADPPAGAVSLPASAVVRIDGRTMVFESTPQGFVPRPVRLVGTAAGRATLAPGGIAMGAKVASTGTSALKALATSEQ